VRLKINAQLARRDDIDVVGTGAGDGDQLEFGRATQQFARQLDLVQQDDFRILNAPGGPGVVRLAQREIADDRLQSGDVEVAGRHGVVIQEYPFHGRCLVTGALLAGRMRRST
jgi:hypothetical protein